MAWTIEYTETALRWLRKADQSIAKRILDFMDERIAKANDPRILGKALTGELRGLWRYRVGDFRLICKIQDKKVSVLVLEIGHRREIYR